MVILKVTKKQGFNLCLEDIIFEDPPPLHPPPPSPPLPPPPSRFGVKT